MFGDDDPYGSRDLLKAKFEFHRTWFTFLRFRSSKYKDPS